MTDSLHPLDVVIQALRIEDETGVILPLSQLERVRTRHELEALARRCASERETFVPAAPRSDEGAINNR